MKKQPEFSYNVEGIFAKRLRKLERWNRIGAWIFWAVWVAFVGAMVVLIGRAI